MKIALYSSYGSNYTRPQEADEFYEENSSYVRTTEIVEVEFTELDHATVVLAQVARVDHEIEDTRADLTRKIQDLEDERSKLLAITHEA